VCWLLQQPDVFARECATALTFCTNVNSKTPAKPGAAAPRPGETEDEAEGTVAAVTAGAAAAAAAATNGTAAAGAAAAAAGVAGADKPSSEPAGQVAAGAAAAPTASAASAARKLRNLDHREWLNLTSNWQRVRGDLPSIHCFLCLQSA
jgi:hypothetical protein